MASAGFLIIFAMVNLANWRQANDIGSSQMIAALGVVACLAALAALIWYTLSDTPAQVLVLVGMLAAAFILEGAYRLYRRGKPLNLS